MWTPVELPFKNENSSPLPTANEIRSCSHVIQRRSAKKVVALNDSVVAKFGSAIDVAEGQALIFLERFAPGVPAPRLHAMFRDGIEVFLVMERAPGMQLDAVWPSLTESEKSSVTSKLSRIFESMRQVECPWPDFFLEAWVAAACATTFSTVREAIKPTLDLSTAKSLLSKA